ncbi:MAG: NUDIX domain-containing protein, partial [Hyphomicrobiales bacterium]|nr:NUDIX domain-containing protein [Hyphomicrobiales bacterium]
AALAAAARALAPRERAGDFAQALMDIGATLCRPRKPDCPLCPLQPDCAAFLSGAPETYPRRSARKRKPQREGAVFFASRKNGAFLARRRPPHGLLASTVELPGTAWTSAEPDAGWEAAAPAPARWRRLADGVEQTFTHFALSLVVFTGGFDGAAPDGCFWIPPHGIDEAGFSNLMRKAVALALAHEGPCGRLTRRLPRKANPVEGEGRRG